MGDANTHPSTQLLSPHHKGEERKIPKLRRNRGSFTPQAGNGAREKGVVVVVAVIVVLLEEEKEEVVVVVVVVVVVSSSK